MSRRDQNKANQLFDSSSFEAAAKVSAPIFSWIIVLRIGRSISGSVQKRKGGNRAGNDERKNQAARIRGGQSVSLIIENDFDILFSENWKFRGPKWQRKRGGKLSSMRQTWASAGLSTKFSWNSRRTSKRCSRKSKCDKMRGRGTRRAYRDKKKWGEIPWNTSIKCRPR